MLVLNLINIFRRRIIKMELIQATNIKLYFGNRIILDIPNLKIYQGDKIGIVGISRLTSAFLFCRCRNVAIFE